MMPFRWGVCALALCLSGCSDDPAAGSCEVGDACEDGNACTDDYCDYSSRLCTSSPHQCPDEPSDCITATCNPAVGCEPVADGTSCAGGTCLAGVCQLEGTVLPCTEQGIHNAIAAGGGPFTFDCEGPTTITSELELALFDIRKDVILDGEGRLTIDGSGSTQRIFNVNEGVVAELRGLTVSGADCLNGVPPFLDICGWGTGIVNEGALTLTNVSVSDASGNGVSSSGALTIVASSIAGNDRGISVGNRDAPALLTISNSTVSSLVVGENTVATIGSSTIAGGIVRFGDLTPAPSISVLASVVGYCDDDEGDMDVRSQGYNIERDNICGFDQTGDQVDVTEGQLNLGPLQDNGGPTMTHALLPGSVAIDVVPEAECVDADGEPLTVDQRGEPRDSMCDVGAFEVQP